MSMSFFDNDGGILCNGRICSFISRNAQSCFDFSQLRGVGACLIIAIAGFCNELSADVNHLVPRLEWPSGPAPYTKVLRVTNDFSVAVANDQAFHDVGDRELFFDINPDYFISIVPDEVAPVNRLVAFPRLTMAGDGTAWITNEKQLIFGSRTWSCAGALLVRSTEMLPILGESKTSYSVSIERFGRQMRLDISKSLHSFYVDDAPNPVFEVVTAATNSESIAEAAPTGVVAAIELARANSPLSAPVKSTTIPPSATNVATTAVPKSKAAAPLNAAAKITVTAETMQQFDTAVVIAKPVVAPPPPPPPARVEPVAVAAAPTPVAAPPAPIAETKPEPVPAAIETNVAVIAPASSTATVSEAATALVSVAPVTGVVAKASAEAAVEKRGFLSLVTLNSWTLWILLGTVLAEGVMILTMFIKRKSSSAQSSAEVFSFTSVGESILDNTVRDYMSGDGTGDLQGELEKFSMGHVVQFFHSSGESGTLTITNTTGHADKLIFDRGQIIDAVCGNRCGEAAAEVILRKRQGSFKFSREDNSRRLRLIQQDTMSLLMEAARVIDEKGWAD